MAAPVGFHHVDVFTPRPYSGNSLAVFPDAAGLTGFQMERITKELRHFESIFLEREEGERVYRARVFDLIEELDFAGHPVIGAASVLHALHGPAETERWTIHLKARTVTVETRRRGPRLYAAVLDQGAPEFLSTPAHGMANEIASWFSLSADDLDPELAPEVVSTGLRYLVLPVRSEALARARIARTDLDAELAKLGAQFAYLLDARTLEGRHWNNDGIVEDVATGSGAGCAAAYLRRHGLIADGEAAMLRQGRFTGRPSEIILRAHGAGTEIRSVEVGGEVALVGEGRLDVLPE
ncbi:MAG TPA: PhzF family phenazine biosynthesis protein [Thermoanaerobaculia bacterium]|nr:PhzF family phenazine biosynthesis protein [Thermoanaerobaculia bacterium]